jgi:hypothetical protein
MADQATTMAAFTIASGCLDGANEAARFTIPSASDAMSPGILLIHPQSGFDTVPGHRRGFLV